MSSEDKPHGNFGEPQPTGDPGSFTQEFQHTQVSARVPERVGRGVFCTGALVLQGPNEFVIDFFRSTPASALFPLFLVLFGVGAGNGFGGLLNAFTGNGSSSAQKQVVNQQQQALQQVKLNPSDPAGWANLVQAAWTSAGQGANFDSTTGTFTAAGKRELGLRPAHEGVVGTSAADAGMGRSLRRPIRRSQEADRRHHRGQETIT